MKDKSNNSNVLPYVIIEGDDNYGVNHIAKRHFSNSIVPNLSRFDFDTKKQLKNLLLEANKIRTQDKTRTIITVRSKENPVSHAQERVEELLVDFGRIIGNDRFGYPTTKAVFGFNDSNHLITAYPIYKGYKAKYGV